MAVVIRVAGSWSIQYSRLAQVLDTLYTLVFFAELLVRLSAYGGTTTPIILCRVPVLPWRC